MAFFTRFSPVLVALAALSAAPVAFAQSSPGYFIPPSHNPAPSHASAPAHAPAQTGAPMQQAQAQLPAIPQLPALPKGAPPPVAVIGVISVPEVMQKSTAAQGVQAVIRKRQEALATAARAARAKIQAEQAQIEADRSTLTDAKLELKEQALRNEVAATQTSFQERNQAIQNSGRASLGIIESELIAIIRQEAQARGMNLVLHREQVALNVNAFDITNAVVGQLNKLLPSVPVPPSVVTPGMAVNPPDQGAGQGAGQ